MQQRGVKRTRNSRSSCKLCAFFSIMSAFSSLSLNRAPERRPFFGFSRWRGGRGIFADVRSRQKFRTLQRPLGGSAHLSDLRPWQVETQLSSGPATYRCLVAKICPAINKSPEDLVPLRSCGMTGPNRNQYDSADERRNGFAARIPLRWLRHRVCLHRRPLQDEITIRRSPSPRQPNTELPA